MSNLEKMQHLAKLNHQKRIYCKLVVQKGCKGLAQVYFNQLQAFEVEMIKLGYLKPEDMTV